MTEKSRNPLEISIFEYDDLAGSCQIDLNDSGTCAKSGARLTQPCSAFDLEDTPESRGAIAALTAKAEAQGATRFFDDPIHVRRSLIHKREAAGAHTAYGHTCSNIIEIMENLYGYVRPPWAEDDRQALPGLMNVQIMRLERLATRNKAQGE